MALSSEVVLAYTSIDSAGSMWTDDGPGYLDLIVSMSEGKVVQFTVGTYQELHSRYRFLNVRITAVGIDPNPAYGWLFTGRLLQIKKSQHGKVRFVYKGDVVGSIDSKGRVGWISLPADFDRETYIKDNVQAISGHFYDPYKIVA